MVRRWFDAIMDNMDIIPLPVELVSFKGVSTQSGPLKTKKRGTGLTTTGSVKWTLTERRATLLL
jgi:hypothetical protein